MLDSKLFFPVIPLGVDIPSTLLYNVRKKVNNSVKEDSLRFYGFSTITINDLLEV